jgi:hypothetical protein
MKIFIYHKLLSVDIIKIYEDLYKQGSFVSHYDWFKDILTLFLQYETDNPDKADFFFIPIFILPFQFISKLNIDKYIDQCQFKNKGRHLLFASGDYGQRAKSFYESHHQGRAYPQIYSWLDDRFILIALESTKDLGVNDIAIYPYQPTFNHFNAMQRRQALSQNILLYAYCGALSYPQLLPSHIRGSNGLITKSGHGKDWFIGTPGQALDLFGVELGHTESIFSRSVFTLCPAGFGRWTFRWIEALLYGSIPVILSDGYLLPFQEYVDWQKYVIQLPERDFHSIDTILRNIPAERILEMQMAIEKDHYLFTRKGCLSMLASKLEYRVIVSL